MKRNISLMAEKKYDLIIIGGGITGASVAWDASLRGLKAALFEKDDFANATSSATSKLIHGGLRYLKNFELGLVRESLSERRIMSMITPQFVFPIPFIVPLYGHGIEGRLPMQAALSVYDLLAYDKEETEDPDKRIPNHKILGEGKVKRLFPGLETKNLNGGALYYDCQMHTPERHVLEFMLSATDYGADVANYAEVRDILRKGNVINGVMVRDKESGEEYKISGKVVANVTGPWGDITLGMLHKKGVEKRLIRSKGIHLVTKEIFKDYGLVLRTKAGRHFFIIPWRGYSLIGTTDRAYDGEPDHFKVSESDIAGLIEDTNENLPGAKLLRKDVLYFYGGLRPIVEKDTDIDVYDASRKYEIYDHEKDDKIKGIITVIGGKYTTSRNLARQVVDMTYKKLGKEPPECLTDTTPLYGGGTGPFNSYLNKEIKKHKREYPKDVVENLIHQYGTEHGRIMVKTETEPGLKDKIAPNRPDILAQVAYAVTDEMALHLDDVVFRRTGLGTVGNPGEAALKKCADVMGELLDWDKTEKKREMGWVNEYYVPIKKDGDIPKAKDVISKKAAK
ncbi:MAG: glycerol-3-phosphate dehydrogenase/oxidase [Deltaproteobacteria bacterium]|uniref:Glycerol-3-phosphate dehydrogenase/oxidase n=1 Tax=Candidatus Zymogenus saltonus TaxID=2844893 RepID=A0A9D8KG14_9DELT|nr:glycerol-3-phosphate dehydrogenase/oxidase [Candidatus Zymogenus saltonus]